MPSTFITNRDRETSFSQAPTHRKVSNAVAQAQMDEYEAWDAVDRILDKMIDCDDPTEREALAMEHNRLTAIAQQAGETLRTIKHGIPI